MKNSSVKCCTQVAGVAEVMFKNNILFNYSTSRLHSMSNNYQNQRICCDKHKTKCLVKCMNSENTLMSLQLN